MARLFYSYSHHDEALRDQLEAHLTTLRRTGELETWHDRRIDAGDLWDKRIRQELEEADIILLLVSANFLASDYCHDIEVERALERHREGTARVVPVVLRLCDWKSTELGQLRATPPDGKPVTTYSDRDEAFLAIVNDIRRLLQNSGQRRAERTPSRSGGTSSMPRRGADEARPRPSIRLRKDFTDLDRDDFLEQAFTEIASRFEHGLLELQATYPEVESRLRQEAGPRFRATLYVNGKQQATCLVRLGSPLSSKGIAYSEGSSTFGDNSYNEILAVDDDGEGLFLKGMFGSFVAAPRERMAPSEAADYLWSRFLGDLAAKSGRLR